MTTALIAILFVLASGWIALRANARLRDRDRLPMQWWLNGDVTWSAPRPIALAFIPATTLLVLAILTVLMAYTQPRPGQEGMVIPTVIALGMLFLAAQLFHIWMIERTFRRDGR